MTERERILYKVKLYVYKYAKGGEIILQYHYH